MSRREWRVAWRRGVGGRLASHRSRNEREARTYARFLVGDLDDPDAYACCYGHECGCGGKTKREAWQEYADTHGEYDPETGSQGPLPPITWGPVIQARTAEPWETRR
jgi:hypothetical protein